jgi:hypothetical protein
MGLDGTPPSVGAGPESESSTTLALQNRWFVERGTAASSPALQASSASRPRFFHQVAFSLVLSHQVHLVNFDHSRECARSASVHHALPEAPVHILSIVEANDPLPQRLVVAGEYGASQIVELPFAVRTAVPLSKPLDVAPGLSSDARCMTVWAVHIFSPAELPYRLEALFIVQELNDA